MQSKEAKLKKQMAAQIDQADSDEAQNEDESDDEDFLKPKKDQKLDKDEEEKSEAGEQKLPSLSKRAMRKIKMEGQYEGKNAIIFDDEGKAISKSEVMAKTSFIEQLKKNKELGVQEDKDVASDSEEGEKYKEKLRKELAETKAKDDKLRKDKIKEKRQKAKRREKEERGDKLGEADDDEAEMVEYDDEAESQEDQQPSDDQSEEQEYDAEDESSEGK